MRGVCCAAATSGCYPPTVKHGSRAFVGRVVSRREFLVLGVAGLAGTSLSGAAGCGGREEGRAEKMVSEPEDLQGEGETLEIPTGRGTVRGILYTTEGARGAVVMVGGAGGDTTGPSGVYEELAARVQDEGVTALRLEYRTPNDLDNCVYDLLAGLGELGERGIERMVLVGWSFGGAVVISAGAASDLVVGVATVAGQSYGAEAVGELSPEKSLLLIHGTADEVLPYEIAQNLYARADEPKELVLYPNDNHGMQGHRSEMLEKLYEFSGNLLLDGSGTQFEER